MGEAIIEDAIKGIDRLKSQPHRNQRSNKARGDVKYLQQENYFIAKKAGKRLTIMRPDEPVVKQILCSGVKIQEIA